MIQYQSIIYITFISVSICFFFTSSFSFSQLLQCFFMFFVLFCCFTFKINILNLIWKQTRYIIRDLWQCTSNLCDALVRGTGRAPCWRPALCDRRGPWGPGPQTAASSADAFSPAGGAERQREIDREEVAKQFNKDRGCPESWAVL